MNGKMNKQTTKRVNEFSNKRTNVVELCYMFLSHAEKTDQWKAFHVGFC